MSKVAKTAAMVVGAVALVATGVGAAIGAGTIIAAGVSVGTVATVANVVAGALTIASAVTAPKPSSTVSGSQTSFSANPDDALPLAIGRTGTAGKITYRIGFDTRDAGDNDRQAFVVTLSVGPIAAIEGQTVDQAPVTYSGTGAAVGSYAGWMWSRAQLGALPEASALGFGTGAGTPPGWTSQHKLSGKAAVTWTLRFDTKGKMFQGGVPAPMWVVRGIACYDPTKDSTYPGGSGPHRMADPADRAAYDAATATWEYSEDPYLLAMRWAHGIYQRDRSNPASTYERVMGIGAPWAMIDVAAFVEGRNLAMANGWKAGGIIYSTDGKWDTMKRILQAGMGEPLALGARISCLVNTPKVSLATITADDVVGAASVGGTQPRRDRINTITPRYRLEANNWQFLPGPPISVAKHVTEDRGKRSRLQDYPFIQSTPQVATAVRYDIENAREFGPIVLPLKLVWMGFKPGDCVTATLPELGLNAQPILLLNRDLAPAGGIVTVTARSETAEKHPFALGQTTTPPATPGVTATPLVPVPRDGDWTLTVLAANGDRVAPSLLITGVAAANVDSVIFEYRLFDAGRPWSAAGSGAANTTVFEITGIPAAGAYEAAISYVRAGVVGDRRIVGPVIVGPAELAWGHVSDPTGTRPEDNATVGAPVGTPVAGRPAEDIVAQIDDLIETYGDTIAAGEYAEAAEAARDASRLAADNAAAARDIAVTAKDGAETARQASASRAEAAAASAEAASTSSTSAGAYRTAAEEAAGAAQEHSNTAATRSGEAKTYRDEAATSATNASGSASTASQQAGLAADSASDAGGSATAAQSSASVASTKADEAGASATVASTAKQEAISAREGAQASAGSASGSAGVASGYAAAALEYRETTATFRDQAAGSAQNAGLSAQAASQTAAQVDQDVGAISQRVDGVEATANGASSTASSALGAVATVQGKVAAYVKLVADAGNGRAALSLWSDEYGGRWALTGDGLIDGDLTINGTLTITKLDRSTMTADTAGAVSGSYGGYSQGKVYVPNLGADMYIRDGGTFLIAFTGTSGATSQAQLAGRGNTFELLDNSGNVIHVWQLPFGILNDHVFRFKNTWGERVVSWRIATFGNANAYSHVTNPNVSVGWSML